MKIFFNNFLKNILPLRRKLFNHHELEKPYPFFVPSGHFYSPFPAIDEIKQIENKLFDNIPRQLSGIDLNEQEQISLLEIFETFYAQMPFKENKINDLRYYFHNDAYSYSDAIILYCMVRHLHPKQVIEIGSGYSSCVFLDTNELFFENEIKCTFIEPYPQTLLSLIKDEDKFRINLIEKKLQDVELSLFEKLLPGDILFVDSTHVSKINSDVNKLIFQILPSLNEGVYIHFHDIFYPFEYPREWIYQGRAWNEDYLLRAFLQFNTEFKIVFWNHFLYNTHKEKLIEKMPLSEKNPGGSIWLRKIEQ
jgi:hypothetical protein